MRRHRPAKKRRHKVIEHTRVIRLKDGRKRRVKVKGSERGGK